MEGSSFKPGSGGQGPKAEPTTVDSYDGKYKERDSSIPEKFAESENPVQHGQLPAKGLRSVGG